MENLMLKLKRKNPTSLFSKKNKIEVNSHLNKYTLL